MTLTIEKDFRAELGAVRHQGRRPTCLAFAASDVHRHARRHPEWFCVEWLYYHVSQHAGTGPHCGTTIADTRTILKSVGQPEEPEWPYSGTPPSPATWRPPTLTKEPLTSGSTGCSAGLQAVRQRIDEDLPIVIGLFTSDTFNQPPTWEYAGDEVILGSDTGHPIDYARGHAVIVAGRGDYSGQPVMLLRNSWGARWGHQGHAWVLEAYLAPRLADAFVISKGEGDVLQSDGRYADAHPSTRLG